MAIYDGAFVYDNAATIYNDVAAGVGSTSIVFANSGTGALGGNIAGSETLTFTVSATVSSNQTISGAGSFSFSSAGTINGYLNMVASSSLSFTVSGTLIGFATIGGAFTIITFSHPNVHLRRSPFGPSSPVTRLPYEEGITP